MHAAAQGAAGGLTAQTPLRGDAQAHNRGICQAGFQEAPGASGRCMAVNCCCRHSGGTWPPPSCEACVPVAAACLSRHRHQRLLEQCPGRTPRRQLSCAAVRAALLECMYSDWLSRGRRGTSGMVGRSSLSCKPYGNLLADLRCTPWLPTVDRKLDPLDTMRQS